MRNLLYRVRPAPKRLARFCALTLVQAAVLLRAATPADSPPYLEPLAQDKGPAGVQLALRRLLNTGRFMMVTAHPDDEDGGLLTLEARGKGVGTLLLTLTRGEGGQNKTGGTFSDELGILRTLELLASDRYYQVEQRFSRVADFGYSKTAEETFEKWGGHDVALADVVRVVREFRPDVLVARFSGTENDGHGHHQASAILAREAFRAAADPNRFPEQIREGLRPWQAKKLYLGNVCGFGVATCPDENWTVRLNTGEEDPLLGTSYVQFAIEGLRHQQSQGLGDLRIPKGPRYAFYKLADSVLPKTLDAGGHEKDFFDGIDASLAGLAGRLGEEERKAPWLRGELETATKNLVAAEGDGQSLPPSLPPALLALRDELRAVSEKLSRSDVAAPLRADLGERVLKADALAQKSLNLALDISASDTARLGGGQSESGQVPARALALSPGQQVTSRVTFHNGSRDRLRVDRLEMKKLHDDRSRSSPPVEPGADYTQEFQFSVPDAFCCTRPYWHRKDPQTDTIYTIDEPRLATLPFAPFPLEAEVTYSLLAAKRKPGADPKPAASLSVPVLAPVDGESGAPQNLPPGVVPVFSVTIEPGEMVVRSAAHAIPDVRVRISSNLDGAPPGTLRLEAPEGWTIEPREQAVVLKRRGSEQAFGFKIGRHKLTEEKLFLRAVLEAGGRKYSEGYSLVTREDLGSFYHFQPAQEHLSVVDLALPTDLKVGYIMGAGDDIPTVLEQVGIDVRLISAESLAKEDLQSLGTIVLGVRAYDTRKEVVANNQKLLEFVRGGGTLVVENNNSVSDFNNGHLTPYPAELSRARVSVEEAPVKLLAPDDPIFHYPNQISEKDFDGWVQERGLYFMDKWDYHFKPLLSCHDPNEPDQKGGLLVAKYGQGTYIYTGYAFFRQLPAGVPGAIRLFVNLISAGRSGPRS